MYSKNQLNKKRCLKTCSLINSTGLFLDKNHNVLNSNIKKCSFEWKVKFFTRYFKV